MARRAVFLADGPRHSNRTCWRKCALRSAGPISGGHTDRAVDPTTKTPRRAALANRPAQACRSNCSPRTMKLYVFARARIAWPRKGPCGQRQLKWLWARLKQLAEMDLSREELLMRLGARVPAPERVAAGRGGSRRRGHELHLPTDRAKLRRARLREGRYLLRTNLPRTIREAVDY